MSDQNERRDFLKIAGAAAVGGIASVALGSTEAAAESRMGGMGAMDAMGPHRLRKVTVVCRPGVKIDSIFEAVKAGIRPGGCLACGLLGIDLNFHVGDPEPFMQNRVQRINVDAPGVVGAFIE